MLQTLSKRRRPSHIFTSMPTAGDGLKDRVRVLWNRKRLQWQRKTDKVNFVPVQMETARVPQEEDWEREIEEFSRRMEEGEKKEKEMSDKTPYGNLMH